MLFSLLISWLGACTKDGCSRKEATRVDEKREEVIALEHPVKINDFPNLNLASLNDTQKSSLIKLFNDEICPCSCPKTFAQCLVNKKECGPGIMLAQWAADHLKANASLPVLMQTLSEEINSGFMSKQVAIKTENAAHKGNKNAPLSIVEFADFECPACKIASRALSKLMKEKGSEIQLYFLHYPLTGHAYAEAAAVAAEAAGRQGKFWEMHDLLFEHEGILNDATLADLGKKIFKTQKEFAQYTKDRADAALLEKVRGDKEYAKNELTLMRTPSFFINGRLCHLCNLSLTEEDFLLRIAMERARVGIACEQNQK